MRSRSGRCVGALALLLVLAPFVACGEETGPETIEGSAFVAAYVDLRLTAMETAGAAGEVRRQAVLAEHGVTEEDLLEFVEVHGRDGAFMRDVWERAQTALDSARLTSRGLERSGGGEEIGPGDEGR